VDRNNRRERFSPLINDEWTFSCFCGVVPQPKDRTIGTIGTGFGIIRADLEKKYDAQFKVVFDAIRQLMTPPEPNKRKIGFLVKERAPRYGRA
jgi:hypothetical protein